MFFQNFSLLEVEIASSILKLVMLLSLTSAIAFFVAAELSLVSASHSQIYQLTQESDSISKSKAANLVLDAQNHLQKYLSVTQTGTTAFSLLLGWLGEGATVHWIEPLIQRLPIGKLPAIVTSHTISVAVAFLLVTYVEIVLGELIPKVLASQAPEKTALLLIRPLYICSIIFFPLLVIFNGTVHLLIGRVPNREYESEVSSKVTFVHTDPYSVLVSGVVELNTVNELFGLNIPTNTAYRTLAGFIIHHLGHAPQTGEILLWGELELEATSVVNESLETVLLRQVTRPLINHQPEVVKDIEYAAI
ncbi:MAG: CNNM domain-containing protein [Crinalium sp.]